MNFHDGLNNFGYGLSFIIWFEFVWNLEIGLKIENNVFGNWVGI